MSLIYKIINFFTNKKETLPDSTKRAYKKVKKYWKKKA
jgi:hypothetical protein